MAHHGFEEIALDDAEGNRIAGAQRDNPDADIFFLEHHGVTVGAGSVAVAFDDLSSYYLERACRQQIFAQSTGLWLKLIEHEVLREPQRQILAQSTGLPLKLIEGEMLREACGRSSRSRWCWPRGISPRCCRVMGLIEGIG